MTTPQTEAGPRTRRTRGSWRYAVRIVEACADRKPLLALIFRYGDYRVAEARGRIEEQARTQVLQVVRQALPGTDYSEVEARVREVVRGVSK